MLASRREGWGLVVSEANAFKTPVVAYRVPGLKDSIKNQKTGLLTIKNNPQELAELAFSLLTNSKFYQKLSENAFLAVQNLNYQKTKEKFLESIKEL